jgi:hypothetical protein
MICKIVEQAIRTGYLTLEAEDQLRQLLQTKYGFEALNAFFSLQKAVMDGRVKQQSRELRMMKSLNLRRDPSTPSVLTQPSLQQ